MLPRYLLVTLVLGACIPKQIQPAKPSVTCEECTATAALAVGTAFTMDLSWAAVCDERHLKWTSHNDGSTQDVYWEHDDVPCRGREFTYHVDCDNCQAKETGARRAESSSITVVPSSEGPFQVRVEIRSGTDRFVWIGPEMTAVRAELELWCSVDGDPLAPCGDRELDPGATYLAVAAPSAHGPHFLGAYDKVSFIGMNLTWGPIPGDPQGRMGVKLPDDARPGTRALGLQWRSVMTAKTITIAGW